MARTSSRKAGAKAVAYSSEHSVLLAFQWPAPQLGGCIGVAIRKHHPDGSSLWIEGLLGFEGVNHVPGELTASNEAPLQKLFWSDYRVRRGTKYSYDIVPVFGSPRRLTLRDDLALTLRIETEQNSDEEKHKVFFNRAAVESQAYARNFGNASPGSDPRILNWLARGLDQAILKFIARAQEGSGLRLDMAAYHFEHPEIIEAVAKLGKRARVSLFWPASKEEEQARNVNARDVLEKAGCSVSLRENAGQLSHNKYIILKDRKGPFAVLTGSTNFTTGGVHLQNNVCHIIESRELATFYQAAFELQFEDDTAGLRSVSKTWFGANDVDAIEVNFSPHSGSKKTKAADLKRYVTEARAAQIGILFATLRTTDYDLISALTEPEGDVVVRGLADNLYEANEGEVLLYHAAHEGPNIVAAPKQSSLPGPMVEEVKRRFTGRYWEVIVHHKFILIDPCSEKYLLITGSANYSENSSKRNDENSLIIRGNPRIAEMYLCEHARIYEHYRARWFLSRDRSGKDAPESLYLDKTDGWLKKYARGSQSRKFVMMLLEGV